MRAITPGMKRIRAFQILHKTMVEGKTKQQAADELGLNIRTVNNNMRWAEQANVFVEYEQRLYTELLPLAHRTLVEALQDGDAQVALEVMKGTNVLKKPGSTSAVAQVDEDNLYGEILKAKQGGDVARTLTGEYGHVKQLGPVTSRLQAIVEAGVPIDVISVESQQRGVHGDSESPESEGEVGQNTAVAPVAADETAVGEDE